MTAKQFWAPAALGALGTSLVIGAIALAAAHWPKPADPTPAPVPVPEPPAPTPGVSVAIAAQKAKLKLSDGRTATFTFSPSNGGLTCAAAVGLDEVLGYALTPVGDPPLPDPPPAPTPPNPTPPVPNPQPPTPQPPTPQPTPRAASNLRVLFLYDPLTLTNLPPGQQAILAAAELRTYLDKHCPLEGGCAGGTCRVTRSGGSSSPSYRFLPANADVNRLSPVWQQTYRTVAGKPPPWLLVVDEAGQTVVDQAWPASVEETLKLLQKFGGP